jgi:hypothetical protein
MPHDPEPKKLFDIAKPGKMLPSASSRPLITGHHDLLQDPMLKVTESVKNNMTAEASPVKVSITPEETPDQSNQTPEPTEDKTEEQVNTQPEDKSEKPDEPELTEKQAEPTHDKQDKPQKPADQSANYDELIQQKTYFAPVGQQQQHQLSARRWLIITVIVLVAGLLIADLLVDNGTIKTSVRPPIQVFNNQ